MTAKEIASKQELELHEALYLIEEYIYEKKGSRVKIALRSNGSGVDMMEFQLLQLALMSSINYFLKQ